MKKLLLILGFTIGLWFIQACCDCGEDTPYVEFFYLSTETKTTYDSNRLLIALYPDPKHVQYVADAELMPSFPFCTSAYGCGDCNVAGISGLKYPLDSITIQADHDFSDAFPAGTSLDSYFRLTTTNYYYERWRNEDPRLDTFEFKLNVLPRLQSYDFTYNYPLFLYLVKQPDTMPAEGFSFTITCHKSNGTAVKHVIPATRW
jgi:hypothetical protein